MGRSASTGFGFGGYATWRAITPVGRLLMRLWFPLTYSGPPVPMGPVVVAANHFSHLDPIVVAAAVGRPMRYLAVDELYGNSRIFDRFTTWMGTIPMTRTGIPFGPLKASLTQLALGGTIGLFPEGVRVWAWGEQPPKRGAAWLAHRAGVPLVPVAVSGSDLAMGRGARGISRAAIHVEICDPILPEEFESGSNPVAAMTDEWRRRIGRAVRSD